MPDSPTLPPLLPSANALEYALSNPDAGPCHLPPRQIPLFQPRTSTPSVEAAIDGGNNSLGNGGPSHRPPGQGVFYVRLRAITRRARAPSRTLDHPHKPRSPRRLPPP